MDPQFVIILLFLVSTSITTLTIYFWPLSISIWSICSLVLLINIVTLGSSTINYDFTLTSYYPSNRFSLGNSASWTTQLYFLFYLLYVPLLSRYIILSFVLCTLVLKIKLVFTHSSWLLSLGFPSQYYWRSPSLASEMETTEGLGGTADKLRPKSYWLHLQSFW